MFKINELQSIAYNYLFAVIYGLLLWHEPFSIHSYTSKPWFDLAIVVGIFFIITFFLMSKSTLNAGVSITAVASRMSVVIPVIAGIIILGDQLNPLKVSGILLAVFSFYLIFKRKVSMKIKWKNMLLPFLLFLGIGFNDAMMKYIEEIYLVSDETMFLTVVFFIAFLISLLVIIFQIISGFDKFSWKSIVAGFILGSLNFGSTYYFIMSMTVFDSSFLFPVFNGSVVVLTSFIGFAVFKEKLSKVNWLGIGIALIAILLITIA